ncbi:DEAD/DEAH box helicase [Lacticaseibacillus mingshuiensis]|uniref:DEAD/DEAH box helicase n=1 Tax=Lacticaseibacillus mingshuiensis TaxID=2799574 RepID=UPI00194F6A4B|nr:DEAD/DEAH box helicase [Lacticaseibacillus mingshuiensis]
MTKHFELDGQTYELVTIAQDQSHAQKRPIVIYRRPGTQQYFVIPQDELISRTKQQKPVDWSARLTLFKSLFVGRTDVYANRYWNKRAEKKAYAPAAPFENGRPSRTHHFELTDAVLLDHLRGSQTRSGDTAIGLYPLAEDNTTKFLVFDIDGHHADQPWQGLSESIVKVCREAGLAPLVELSQSGSGSHIWLLFATPLAASIARRLGDELLKATQAIDPRLPFTAFDRLFSAQDQLGPGQFGNLIAAPLEAHAARDGQSVFVDEAWKPFSDQWAVLAKADRLSSAKVKETIDRLSQRAGFRLYDEADEEDEPDIFTQPYQITKPLTIIRANALYVLKADLDAEALLHLKWLASFRNPVFYERQKSRMPVNLTPRIISLYRESPTYLILPRGLEDQLAAMVASITWQDKVATGTPLDVHFNGTLRPNQVPAFNAMMANANGILAARTGFGKTVIGANLIAKRAVSTLILVPNKTLAEQWRKSLQQLLTINTAPTVVEHTPSGRKRRKPIIGTYYGQKKNCSGLVDIATVQAVSRLQDSRTFLDRYGMVISDEVHHDAASTFDRVIGGLRARYLYGLSATPYRRDGQAPILTMRFGPIRFRTEAVDPEFALSVQRTVIPRFTNFGMTDLETLKNGIVENRTAMLHDEARDAVIIRDIKNALKAGRHLIVLTSLVEHVDQLYSRVKDANVYRIYGRFSAKERSEEITRIMAETGPYVILATTATAGEGLDIATLDTLLLAMPIGYHGNLEQYLGRMHRDLGAKSSLIVYDYVDMFVPMLMRMYRKRRKTYQALGYTISEDAFTKQRGPQVFDGHCQVALSQALSAASSVMVVVPRAGRFLQARLENSLMPECTAEVYTQFEPTLPISANSHLHLAAFALPNCVVIDGRQLWISIDAGFENNRGMTIRLDHPELVSQLVKMMADNEGRLPL